jgi:gas vesicle structural protein
MAGTEGYLSRPTPSGLADVVEVILDRGIVIDAYVRVSLLGIELLTVDARIVVASVDTYLRFAEATNRLDLWEDGGRSLPDMLSEGAENVATTVAADVVEDKITDGIEAVGGAVETVAGKAADVAGQAVEKAADAITPDSPDEDG